MPLSNIKQAAKPKTKTELEAELRDGDVRLDKDTKVVALETGYSDTIREPGDVFYVKKGTIYRPGYTWFEPVTENTPTKEETESLEDMSVAELKVALAQAGVGFAGITKKADLIDLLAKHQAEQELA